MGVNPTLEALDDRGGSELALGLPYLRPSSRSEALLLCANAEVDQSERALVTG
jgi:hypothetical protein